jgi:hypothetical protein
VQGTAQRRRRRRQQHLAGSAASAAALTINNQLKVLTAAATETATMTATTMTMMETKATAATCFWLLATPPPPPPTPRYRQAAAAAAKLAATAKLAAAYALPPRFRCRRRLWQDSRRRQRGLWTAQSTTNHCLSVGFGGIDGGCEHYLPFHQPQSDDFMPDANDQQIWLIASPVAQPPPIRLVPLHPNTMGDAANVRFCQNHWWGG